MRPSWTRLPAQWLDRFGCRHLPAILQKSTLVLAAGLLLSPVQSVAQIPAFLPVVTEVAAGNATDADGTYEISTIGKRITISQGRAFVIDPWKHAFVLDVQPGMVVLRDFRQTGPDRFEAEDLPMMGNVTFFRQPNGALQGEVTGALGTSRYVLLPRDLVANPPAVDLPGALPDALPTGAPVGAPPALQPAQDREYQIYVHQVECLGSSVLRRTYRGVFSLGVTDGSGEDVRSDSRNFEVKCTRRGPRTQDLSADSGGEGTLNLVVPAGQDGFSDFTIYTSLFDLLGVLDYANDQSSLLTVARNMRRDLNVGETVTNVTRIQGDNAQLRYHITLRRIR